MIDWSEEHLLRDCIRVTYVNIGSYDGLVPPGNKQTSVPMMTMIIDVIQVTNLTDALLRHMIGLSPILPLSAGFPFINTN